MPLYVFELHVEYPDRFDPGQDVFIFKGKEFEHWINYSILERFCATSGISQLEINQQN